MASRKFHSLEIRAATNIRFVRIFVRILVFRFNLFAFGIRLHEIYVIYAPYFGASRPVL